MSEPARRPDVRQKSGGAIPGILKGLATTAQTLGRPTHTAEYPDAAAPPATTQPRRHRAARGELHLLHAVRPRVPRLVHLHRLAQGDDPGHDRGWARAAAQRARPVRHRLQPVHVLRHLHRGVPVRRAALEPGVRVLRARHPRPAAREGPARPVDGHRAAAAGPGPEAPPSRPRSPRPTSPPVCRGPPAAPATSRPAGAARVARERPTRQPAAPENAADAGDAGTRRAGRSRPTPYPASRFRRRRTRPQPAPRVRSRRRGRRDRLDIAFAAVGRSRPPAACSPSPPATSCTPPCGSSSASERWPAATSCSAPSSSPWCQLLVYVGAVVVLVLFALMLTRAPDRAERRAHHRRWRTARWPAVLGAAVTGCCSPCCCRSRARRVEPAQTPTSTGRRAAVRHLGVALRGTLAAAARRAHRGPCGLAHGARRAGRVRVRAGSRATPAAGSATSRPRRSRGDPPRRSLPARRRPRRPGRVRRRWPGATPCSSSSASSWCSTRPTAPRSVATRPVGADRWAAGNVLPLFVITIAAAEVVVALAIVLAVFRLRGDIDLDEPASGRPDEPTKATDWPRIAPMSLAAARLVVLLPALVAAASGCCWPARRPGAVRLVAVGSSLATLVGRPGWPGRRVGGSSSVQRRARSRPSTRGRCEVPAAAPDQRAARPRRRRGRRSSAGRCRPSRRGTCATTTATASSPPPSRCSCAAMLLVVALGRPGAHRRRLGGHGLVLLPAHRPLEPQGDRPPGRAQGVPRHPVRRRRASCSA